MCCCAVVLVKKSNGALLCGEEERGEGMGNRGADTSSPSSATIRPIPAFSLYPGSTRWLCILAVSNHISLSFLTVICSLVVSFLCVCALCFPQFSDYFSTRCWLLSPPMVGKKQQQISG
mmetsp:Transcript_19799/g.50642  ORF Transcript_19799/g.50642 Transcript_19799/m.50642 type:complete len:119 (+) Transcript_19799:1567-1923(+)